MDGAGLWRLTLDQDLLDTLSRRFPTWFGGGGGDGGEGGDGGGGGGEAEHSNSPQSSSSSSILSNSSSSSVGGDSVTSLDVVGIRSDALLLAVEEGSDSSDTTGGGEQNISSSSDIVTTTPTVGVSGGRATIAVLSNSESGFCSTINETFFTVNLADLNGMAEGIYTK